MRCDLVVDATMIFWKFTEMCGLRRQCCSIMDLFSFFLVISLQTKQMLLATACEKSFSPASSSCCIVYRNSRNVINCQQEIGKNVSIRTQKDAFIVPDALKKVFLLATLNDIWLPLSSHNMRSNSSQWDTLETLNNHYEWKTFLRKSWSIGCAKEMSSEMSSDCMETCYRNFDKNLTEKYFSKSFQNEDAICYESFWF